MSLGFHIFFLMLWLFLMYTCALLLFTKGFLLNRIVMSNISTCEEENWYINNLWSGITTNVVFERESISAKDTCNRLIFPKFHKALLIVIDGLRYDFMQYREEINLTSALPYQNKMKKLHSLMLKEPSNGKLYKFEADPPTTTMQRIKGLTTGSLPTFVDAGSNFDSYEITEDNILDHALRYNKNISFMGCSTWTELFPKQFYRKTPYSALNVKDLDTIDYGIMKSIGAEVKRSDWSIIIAHFLGVDHCGHRYGTNHPEMTRKLSEMDSVISDLTGNIDNDTILFVMGDHGMTITGDHGGDSGDEVMAGLFAYSKRSIFKPSQLNGQHLPTVSQIDLVPTLSLLLDQPIPFSNLGSIIPDFFDGDVEMFIPENLKQRIKGKTSVNVFKQINKVYSAQINCKQILAYIDQYQTFSDELPSDRIEMARASYEYSVDKFNELLQIIVTIDWENKTLITLQSKDISEYVKEMQVLDQSFQDVLQSIKKLCRNAWAQFDLFSMCLGLSLMGFISATLFIMFYSTNVNLKMETGIFNTSICIIGLIFTLVGVAYLIVPMHLSNDTSAFIVFGAISFSFSLWLTVCGSFSLWLTVFGNILLFRNLNHVFNFQVLIQQLSSKGWIFLVAFLAYLGSLFSNSFIIYEDVSTMFLLQSLVLFYAFSCFVNSLKCYKIQAAKDLRSKCYMQLKTVVLNFCFNSEALKITAIFLVLLVCIRLTKNFWFCREMQLTCVVSTYSLPLSALITDFTDHYAQERIFLAIASLFSLLLITRWYLQKRGNLYGFSSIAFVMKILAVLCFSFMVLHWIFLLILSHPIASVFNVLYWQQIIFPRIVYTCFILSVILLTISPLGLAVVFQNQKNLYRNISVPELLRVLKDNISKRLSKEASEPPLVYGLQTVYSSAFIVLAFKLTVVICLVLSDGMIFSVLLLWVAAYCVLGIFGFGSSEKPWEYGDMFCSVLVWSFFSVYGFFGTGHQTTIPAIRFPAAYIGFEGSSTEIVPQVMVILLNTFASQIVCSLALPLLFLSHKNNFFRVDEKDKVAEVHLIDNGHSSRINLFRLSLLYMAIFMCKVFITASSATLHRRHLMVWKIFAPRFLFEAVSFLISVPILLLGYCFYLRIDSCLCTRLEKLEIEVEQNRDF
ncbi:GPI ethanolamine phosphate transferase 3 isoform X2 [Hydra vulgaris]|uniref:GPI ethanolamine phosphate transferase 3 isoform X2 n=1 Tax=Hydra vulgaris TaxID=6087 RepID=A0ABM4DDF3_HYDVU